MQLEQQVIPLSMAQRLKELGVKQESYFSWYVTTGRDDTPALNKSGFHCPTCGHPYAPYFRPVAAFTASEIIAMLPDYTQALGNLEFGKASTDHVSMKPYKNPWYNVSYWTWENKTTRSGDIYLDQKAEHLQQSATLAEAACMMLIHLLENKLITADEVNARL